MQHNFSAIVLPHITDCVSVFGGVDKKHLKNFPQPLVLQKGYYKSQTILISTEFYKNLIANCREKLWKRKNTFLQTWFLFDSLVQPRSWEVDPHQQIPLVSKNSAFSQFSAWENKDCNAAYSLSFCCEFITWTIRCLFWYWNTLLVFLA